MQRSGNLAIEILVAHLEGAIGVSFQNGDGLGSRGSGCKEMSSRTGSVETAAGAQKREVSGAVTLNNWTGSVASEDSALKDGRSPTLHLILEISGHEHLERLPTLHAKKRIQPSHSLLIGLIF